MRQSQRNDDITLYLENKEYIANRYLMKCFTVMMLVYLAAFILNIVGVFIIESTLIWRAFCSSLLIYISVFLIAKWVTYANKYLKYVMLFSIVLVFTITGVYITYHVALISLLPFLYATLYSSKSLTRFVFILNVISTFIVVYGGYQYGLCDANMVLLTTNRTQDYVRDNQFILTELNSNPGLNLFLFFVMPRCLIYIAFTTVCSSIFKMLSGSLEKAKLSAELEKAKLEAERANMAKTRFLNRMSHEIRTPINAVIGMNEMILRESTESNIKEYANDVKDSSVVLLNLVNEILDSSKIESGMMEIVPANYELGSILNDIYNMTGIKAREKNLKLVWMSLSPEDIMEMTEDSDRYY